MNQRILVGIILVGRLGVSRNDQAGINRNAHTGVSEKTLLRIRRQVGKSGWIAVSGAGSHGQGSSKRIALFTDTGSMYMGMILCFFQL